MDLAVFVFYRHAFCTPCQTISDKPLKENMPKFYDGMPFLVPTPFQSPSMTRRGYGVLN